MLVCFAGKSLMNILDSMYQRGPFFYLSMSMNMVLRYMHISKPPSKPNEPLQPLTLSYSPEDDMLAYPE